MDKKERARVKARLITGGMAVDAAERAADILAAPDPGAVSDATLQRIDRANARVKAGTGWNAGGAQ